MKGASSNAWYDLDSPVVHNQSRVEVLRSGAVAVWSPGIPWGYAAAFPLNAKALEEGQADHFLEVRIALGAVRGEIDVCLLSRDADQVLVHRLLTDADQNSTIEMLAGPISRCGDLLVRNGSGSASAGYVEVRKIEACAEQPKPDQLHYELRLPNTNSKARVEALPSGGVMVTLAEIAWAHAASFPLRGGSSVIASRPDDCLNVRVNVGQVHGNVGLGILSREGDRFLVQRQLTEIDANETINLLCGPVAASGDFVVRNVSASGDPGRIELRAIEASAVDAAAPRPADETRDWSGGKLPVVHNQSRVEVLRSGAVAVWSPGIPWGYAAAFPLNVKALEEGQADHFLEVRIALGAVRGEIDVCLLSRDADQVLVHRLLTDADQNSTIEMLAGPISRCGDLLVRNGSGSASAGYVEVRKIEACAEQPKPDQLHYELRLPNTNSKARVEALPSGGVMVTLAEIAWAHAASFPLRGGSSVIASRPDDCLNVRVNVGQVHGNVGLGILSREGDRFLVQRQLTEIDANETINLLCGPVAASGDFVVRNVSASGDPGRIELRAIEASAVDAAAPHPADQTQDWSGGKSALDLTSLVRRYWPLIAKDQSITTEFRNPTTSVTINVVDIGELGTQLGFGNSMDTKAFDRSKGYLDRRMETDDSKILAYIYRNYRPSRHLEFGTWEGYGAALCAANCEAEIWTLNLPEGEKTESGSAVYDRTFTNDDDVPADLKSADGATLHQTDAGNWIGWRYRKAGYADRVRQILIDSRKWDASHIPDGFFDTILIDGGHSTAVVTSDTQKSLRLLRSGGLILWHDFCPAALPMGHSVATRGVVNALHTHWYDWSPHFECMFWIRPSFILVGKKKLFAELAGGTGTSLHSV